MSEVAENREKSPQRSPQVKQYRDRSSNLASSNNNHHTLYKSPTQTCKPHKSPARTNRTQRGRTLERKAPHDETEDNENENAHGSQNKSEEKDPEQEMMKLMGFGSFGTTKNKHVAGVGSGSIKKNKKAEYRQYMNREKGFNRALSPERR